MRMQDRNKVQNNRKSNQDWVRENRESEDLEEIDLEAINLEEDIWEKDVEDDWEDWREEPEPEDRIKAASRTPAQAKPAPRAILAPFPWSLPEGVVWYIL